MAKSKEVINVDAPAVETDLVAVEQWRCEATRDANGNYAKDKAGNYIFEKVGTKPIKSTFVEFLTAQHLTTSPAWFDSSIAEVWFIIS